MPRKTVYLLLCLAGIFFPYWHFAPWVAEHGLDARLFLEQLFANPISSFFGADVMVSAIVVSIFAWFERARLGGKWWLPIAAVFAVGVSLGLPLLLYLREGAVSSELQKSSA